MTDGSSQEPWLEPLCHVPLDFRAGDASIRELFKRAASDVDDAHFVDIVTARLVREPGLVESWQQYSYDKRGTPSPYLDRTEVGFLEVIDDQVHHRAVEHFDNLVEACSSFI